MDAKEKIQKTKALNITFYIIFRMLGVGIKRGRRILESYSNFFYFSRP